MSVVLSGGTVGVRSCLYTHPSSPTMLLVDTFTEGTSIEITIKYDLGDSYTSIIDIITNQ